MSATPGFEANFSESSPWVEPPAFATDEENRIVYWNRAAESLLGVSKSDAIGQPLSALLSWRDLHESNQTCVLRIPGARGDAGQSVYLLRPASSKPSTCPLSPRELEILSALSHGWAALNIAARLHLSRATVRNHIQNILRKLDVHGQVEAVALALRNGWIDEPVRTVSFRSRAGSQRSVRTLELAAAV